MRRKLKRGFTLTEVVVATSIVAMGVLAFSAVFPAGARAMAVSRHRDLAAQAAHQELEYWRAAGYILIHRAVLDGANSATQAMVTPLPPELAGATGRVTLTRAAGDFSNYSGAAGTDTGRLRATVLIRWTETGPTGGSLEVSTIVANNSLEDAVDQDEVDDGTEDTGGDPDTADDQGVDDIDAEQDDENLDLGLPLPPALPGR